MLNSYDVCSLQRLQLKKIQPVKQLNFCLRNLRATDKELQHVKGGKPMILGDYSTKKATSCGYISVIIEKLVEITSS